MRILKRIKIVWNLLRFAYQVRGQYQPPFGSVGHAIQTGRLTEETATVYLDKKADEHYARVAKGLRDL